MAASSTQIANLALTRLGQKRIESISESTTEARWCNEFYATARDYVTELHMWRHAKTTVSLSTTTNTRDDDYDYAYTRPSDCLSLRYILPSQGQFDPRDPIRFECEGDVIFTDEYQARAVYIKQITDVTKFSPTFTDALSWYLAHLLVQPLRQENKLLQVTADAFEKAIGIAISRSEIEQLFIRTAEESQPDWLTYR